MTSNNNHLPDEPQESFPTELPLVLTVDEVSKLLRISRGTAYEAVRTGRIPSVRLGRKIRVPRHLLESMLGADQAPSRTGPA